MSSSSLLCILQLTFTYALLSKISEYLLLYPFIPGFFDDLCIVSFLHTTFCAFLEILNILYLVQKLLLLVLLHLSMSMTDARLTALTCMTMLHRRNTCDTLMMSVHESTWIGSQRHHRRSANALSQELPSIPSPHCSASLAGTLRSTQPSAYYTPVENVKTRLHRWRTAEATPPWSGTAKTVTNSESTILRKYTEQDCRIEMSSSLGVCRSFKSDSASDAELHWWSFCLWIAHNRNIHIISYI